MTVIDQVYQEDRAPHADGHPRILALANQKGGVGKTTTGLGIDRHNRNCSTYDVLIGEAALRDAVVPTAVPRLHIASSTMDLSGLELELGSSANRAFRLRDAIASLNNNVSPENDYTYVL